MGDGKLFCYEDYLKQLKSICAACNKPIPGRSITAMGKVWHPEHFTCAHCYQPFPDSNFKEHDGKPYYKTHYLMLFADICDKCAKPIHGSKVNACGKFWHPACFSCSGCEAPLKGKYVAWENKPLCAKCYGKLPSHIRHRIEKKKKFEGKREAERKKLEKIQNKKSALEKAKDEAEMKKIVDDLYKG